MLFIKKIKFDRTGKEMANKNSSFHMGDEFNGSGKKTYCYFLRKALGAMSNVSRIIVTKDD